MVGKLEVGSWVLDTHNGDIYEITNRWPDIFTDWYELVKKIDGDTKAPFRNHFKTTANQTSIDTHFVKADSARILYGKNNTKI